MKNFILSILLIVISMPAFSQQGKPEESKSQAVEFLNRDGVLLNKDFYEVGNVGGVKFENLIMTDVVSGKKTAALRIETSYYSSVGGTDTYIGTLDADEIDACIKSLTYMQEKMSKDLPESYTETIYSTRDGVSFGCFVSSGKTKSWSTFVKTQKYSSRSQKFLKSEDVAKIIELLELSKTGIKEKLAE